MSFYVLTHTDSPDGTNYDLRKLASHSMAEARTAFERSRYKELQDWAGPEEFKGQIDYLKNTENKYVRVAFLDVNNIEEFDYEEFRERAVHTLTHHLDKQRAKENEDKDLKEYKRLKQKFEK